jgi:hypothetical protein
VGDESVGEVSGEVVVVVVVGDVESVGEVRTGVVESSLMVVVVGAWRIVGATIVVVGEAEVVAGAIWIVVTGSMGVRSGAGRIAVVSSGVVGTASRRMGRSPTMLR